MSTPIASGLRRALVVDDTIITPTRRAIPNSASFAIDADSTAAPAVASYPHLVTTVLAQ